MDTITNPSIGYLSGHGLEQHYGVSPAWDYPGFYVGNAGDIRDLVHYWKSAPPGSECAFWVFRTLRDL